MLDARCVSGNGNYVEIFLAKLWQSPDFRDATVTARDGKDLSETDESSSLRAVLTRRQPLQVECTLQALRHTARSREERMEVLSALDGDLAVWVPLLTPDDGSDLDG